ncbi:MAG: ATP-binding protein [Bacteroidales bacterium]|nr:ATP-binding protein [Bacteroidales bacterium]
MQQVGKPVTGRDFIGREKELALLMEYMKMGQSVVLIAPRRFGKTSLVLEVLNRLKKQKYYTAFVDVFTNPILDLLSSEITEEVLKNHKLHKQFIAAKNSATALIQNLKLKAVLDDFQFIIGFADNTKNEWDLISESIDFVDAFSKKHNSKMICAYDEFGDIGKFDPKGNLVKLFRSKIQQHTHSTYIFSGSYESVMQNLFISNKSPFYRLARIIHLSYVEKEPLCNYLKKRFTQIKIKITKSYPEQIVEHTMGHPYYTQLAFQQSVLFHTFHGRLPDIDELIVQMLDVEKDYLEKVWEDISNSREYVHTLRAIAENGKNLYKRLKPKKINVARATKKLEGMGFLFRDNIRGWFISDPLFQQWIKKNI